MIDLDPRGEFQERRPQPAGGLKTITLDAKKEHTTQIGSELPANLENELKTFLRENIDLFAWTPADMPGIDPEFLCHKLMIDPKAKPISHQTLGRFFKQVTYTLDSHQNLHARSFIQTSNLHARFSSKSTC